MGRHTQAILIELVKTCGGASSGVTGHLPGGSHPKMRREALGGDGWLSAERGRRKERSNRELPVQSPWVGRAARQRHGRDGHVHKLSAAGEQILRHERKVRKLER